jgi:copper transport protein
MRGGGQPAIGLLAAVGAAVFALAVWRPEARRAGVDAAEPPALAALTFGGFFFAFLGASGLTHHHEAATRSSIAYEVGGLLALVGATVAAIGLFHRRFRLLALAAAIALLPVPTVAGHALDPTWFRPLNAAADLLHVASAAVWTGGLLALALTLLRPQRLPYAPLVRRFSTVALVSVLVLAATGLARALYDLSAVSQLWSTGYGRAIVIKTALLAALVGLGWLNRYRLLPNLAGARESDTVGRLRLSVRAEIGLLVGVVVAAAFLTDLPPGRRAAPATAAAPAKPQTPPLPPRGAVLLARQHGADGVLLAAEPTGRVTAIFTGGDGYGVDGLDVSFDAGDRAVAARSCGAGCYSANLQARPRRVAVEFGVSRIVFSLPRRPTPGGGAVARATRAFERLASIAFRERLASSPKDVVISTWRAAAPNRFSYAIDGGASAIVVGGRRWDRSKPGAPWTPSPQTPLPQPRAPWFGRVTNAYVVRSTARTLDVSFYLPDARAWFLIAIERRTGRTLETRMIAPAHFMRDRYFAFNRVAAIRPPRS